MNPEPGTLRRSSGQALNPSTELRASPESGAPPRITIVTPSFNQGQYLEQTIRSVLDQNYPNLEYIVMDGGSTDGSVPILKRYAARLTHWVSERDAGQADAINMGLGRATGDILAYLNSDDVYEPGALDTVGRFFAAHPETDVVYGHYCYVDARGAVLQRHVPPLFDLTTLALGDFISQPTVFMRRRVWQTVGRFDTRLHCVLDWDYWLRAALKGCRFDRCAAALARMRMHAASKTMTVEPQFWAEAVGMFDRLFADAAVPEALQRARPRVYARVLWLSAIALARAGRGREAQAQAAQAHARLDLLQHMEELDFMLQRLLYSRPGKLISLTGLRGRLRKLGFDREMFQALAQAVDEEGVARLRQRVQAMSRGRALLVLTRAIVLQPRRLLDWSMREALRQALAGKK